MRGKVKGRQALLHWFDLAEQTLGLREDQLNRLNVFPVPDSDTGSNMLAALGICRSAVEDSDGEDLGDLLAVAGSSAMIQAHGNSGTLLAVLLSGFAEPLHGQERLTAAGLADALDRGSLRAWTALSEPVHGTMLSVLDAVRTEVRARAASAAEPESRAALEDALVHAVDSARVAVEATTAQLDVLQQAGVVDAGGTGLLLIIASLQASVSGVPVAQGILEGLRGVSREDPDTGAGPRSSSTGAVAPRTWETDGAAGALVEIMATVHLDPLGAASLRHQLDDLGDSVIITPVDVDADAHGAYRWRIHVHTATSDPTTEVIRTAGAVEDLSVTELAG